MKRVAVSHSGGKDSMLALYRMFEQKDVSVEQLITTINEDDQRTSGHGNQEKLLDLQAEKLGLPLQKVYLPASPTNDVYEQRMMRAYQQAEKDGITHIVFGDINLEDIRRFREQQLDPLNLVALFPLWQEPTDRLLNEFLQLGFETWITAIDSNRVPETFLGASLDHDTVNTLPDSVDPCGENGEFHTFVVDGPIFQYRLPVQLSKTIIRGSFYTYRDVDFL